MDSIIGGGNEIRVGCILSIKTTLGDELELSMYALPIWEESVCLIGLSVFD
ncbi:hypothetical protein HYC85_008293 [Camellia sinensis]|uniref:Uncharacterized protein n=1 Tax=Camellia sinensis TaxID=4442 RepID=A0A7J7HST6_CAMSI|nr:hypothetical protein HYC85_008293 [Camellia sinensis]